MTTRELWKDPTLREAFTKKVWKIYKKTQKIKSPIPLVELDMTLDFDEP